MILEEKEMTINRIRFINDEAILMNETGMNER